MSNKQNERSFTVSSSQSKTGSAVFFLFFFWRRLPPQKERTTNTQVLLTFLFHVGTLLVKIQFPIYSIFQSQQTKNLYPHTKIKSWRTHDCELKKEKEKPPAGAGQKGIAILPSILLSMQIPICGSTYSTTRTWTRLLANSIVNLFLLFLFFFLRGVRKETTQPLRTAVALLHDIHIWILR